jgi:glycosyltransferase involved in cell wall biosynthesis
MRHDILVSVVVPLEDDRDILPAFMEEVDTLMARHFGSYELIFVDDGSTDGTLSYFEHAAARYPCFRYFRLTRPFGFEVAIACGLEQAIGDVIVVLKPSADPLLLIPEFVDKAMDTKGVVVGIRSARSHGSLLYRTAYNVYHAMCRIFLERSQPYGATHFIALTRTALNALLKIKDSFRYIRVLAMYAGFSVTAIPFELIERRQKPRRREIIPLLASAGNMIVSNSDRPLRIAAFLSALISAADFLFLLLVLLVRMIWTDVEPGWASTNVFNAVMFAVMFLVLSILCQYLAEIRSEIKRRPLYVVQTELQSNVMSAGDELRNIVTDEKRPEAFRSMPPRTGNLRG